MEETRKNGGSSVLTLVESSGIRWMHATSTSETTLRELKRRFDFHDQDLKDVKPPLQRPKLVLRDGYLFLILLYPYYHRKLREIWITEVDFFIGRDFLVTVNHQNESETLKAILTSCLADDAARAGYFDHGVSGLLYKLLYALHHAAFPMLVHISQDIDDLEDRLFDTKARGMIGEILRIKTSIVDFRRAVQGHKPVLEKLVAASNGLLEIKKSSARWNDLTDITKEVWSYLETQRETITALHETHASLLTARINDVMKRLTLVSVVLLPLTLIASLFGMNLEDVPFASNPFGFWIIVLILVTTFLGVVGYFKSRDWV